MSGDLEALRPEVARLDVLIESELRRMRARYELSQDELHGLHITDEQVDALLRAVRPPLEPLPAPEIAAARAADDASRWRQLADALPLDDDERDLLLVCLAPELDPKYEALYAYLNDDVTRRWPTADLAVRLLARDEAHALRLRGLLLPTARLLALGVIEMPPGPREQSRGRRPLRPAPPLPDWVRGLAYVDERLAGMVRFGAFESLLPDAALPAAARDTLQAIAHRLRARTPLPPVVLTAASAPEAALFAEQTFARAQRLVLVVDLAALRTGGAAAQALAATELAAGVLQLGVVLTPLEAALDQDQRVPDALAAPLRRLVQRLPAVVLAGAASTEAGAVLADLSTMRVAIPDMSPRERAALWRAALPGAADGAQPAADELVEAVADRFVLGPDRVFLAAAAAGHLAALAGATAPGPDQVFAAARAVSVDGSGGTTRAVRTTYTWDDLVLPRDVKRRLDDVVTAIEHRSRVLDEWGFVRRTGGARGITVMFAGPSGTGKTMAAAVVAGRLQLELQRIELGVVVSKYIGETEKNLDRAFEAARRANALLFVDEADALLGRRSQVKDAHDRYANVEIAYLLQKMEDHDGVVIVATNLAQNVDEAFSRRMQYVVDFPPPDVATRERLWRGMIPPAAPRDDAIDFGFLARQFELTGGEIRNVVLDAAYQAVRDGAPISIGHLLHAVSRQYEKRGQVLTPADLREHYHVLADAAPSHGPGARSSGGPPASPAGRSHPATSS